MKECTSFDVFGMGQSLILLTFSGLGEIPFADRIYPKKLTSVWKKKDFLGLTLSENFFSLENMSSIRSNIWSAESAKIQMSSR